MSELGTDLWWADDVDPTHRLASGLTLLSQAIYRRIITPRGRLLDDPDYGIDVRAYLHRGLTPTDVARVASQIAAEIRRDERVETVQVELADDGAGSWRISIRGESAEGPFHLVVSADQAGARLLEAG